MECGLWVVLLFGAIGRHNFILWGDYDQMEWEWRPRKHRAPGKHTAQVSGSCCGIQDLCFPSTWHVESSWTKGTATLGTKAFPSCLPWTHTHLALRAQSPFWLQQIGVIGQLMGSVAFPTLCQISPQLKGWLFLVGSNMTATMAFRCQRRALEGLHAGSLRS